MCDACNDTGINLEPISNAQYAEAYRRLGIDLACYCDCLRTEGCPKCGLNLDGDGITGYTCPACGFHAEISDRDDVSDFPTMDDVPVSGTERRIVEFVESKNTECYTIDELAGFLGMLPQEFEGDLNNAVERKSIICFHPSAQHCPTLYLPVSEVEEA